MSDAKVNLSQHAINISLEESLNRAHEHWNAGQWGHAEQICQQILAIWPGNAHALHLMGLMAHGSNRTELAIDYLKTACCSPQAPVIYLNNLAEMLRQHGQLEEAKKYGRRALSMDNSEPSIWNNLGIILQELGEYEESLRLLEPLVQAQPKNAQAHNNLANTYKRLGKLNLAKKHWLIAIEIAPQYAECYSNLSILSGDLFLYDEAIDYGRRAIEINPQLQNAYLNLAAVENSRHRFAQAIQWLDSLLHFSPQHLGALNAKAITLMHLGELEQALFFTKKAADIKPIHPETMNNQGLILSAMGKSIEATECFQKAIEIPSTTHQDALINLANHLAQEGSSQKALEIYEQAIEKYPRSASAWFNRGDLISYHEDDPAISKMQEVLQLGSDLGTSDTMLIHFALGKAFLDLGNSAKAFEYLNKGNHIKRQTFQFDIKKTAIWMEKIAACFSSEFIERGKSLHASQQGNTPIFVIGMPRSGTTLIEQILASHPDVFGAGELKYVQHLIDQFPEYPLIQPELTPRVCSELGEKYLQKIAPFVKNSLLEYQHVVDKMPINFLHAGLIHMILPQAKIIHSRRNAVDTCLSIYSKLFSDDQLFSYDLDELGQFYVAYEKIMAHWRQVLPETHFLEIDYENVIKDTEDEARRMLDFLNLPWNPQCLEFYKTQRTVRTASSNQIRKPIYKSSVKRWKKHSKELQPLLAALGVR